MHSHLTRTFYGGKGGADAAFCIVLMDLSAPTEAQITQWISRLRISTPNLPIQRFFQSQYSYAANLALDIQFKSPVIISNAANPRIFNRLGRVPFGRDRKIRLISSSWSSNPNKGAASYRELESLLDWDKFEYTFVGRTEVQFDRIRTLAPVPSDGLADLLRKHDVYVTASLHDPCSNAVIEALTCGLPVIYVNSGGHAELVADAGYPFSHVTEIPDLLDRLVDEYETRQSRIQLPLLSDVANQYLDAMQIEH